VKRVPRILKTLLILGLLGFAALLLYGYARQHPEDMPWTELDLSRPVGAFTGRKLARLRDDPSLCRRLLADAGIRHMALAPRNPGTQCGYSDAVRLRRAGAVRIAWRPADLGTSCPVAAGLALWEWHVVQPAALKHFGSRVTEIEHFGSYNCRRIYGRDDGAWSEHATANAVDVAGFRLENGRRLTLIGDWDDDGPRAAFLREVRDGACDLFSTVLSPDYNAAHRDHFHLDQAARGASGWRGCR
jgi:hypothetical protein